jgi:hypothetical protein
MAENEPKKVAETPAAKTETPTAPAAKKAARVWHKDPKTGKVKETK